MSLTTATSLSLNFLLFFLLFLFPLFSCHSPFHFHLLPPMSLGLLCILPVHSSSTFIFDSFLPSSSFSSHFSCSSTSFLCCFFFFFSLSTALCNSTLVLLCKGAVQWDYRFLWGSSSNPVRFTFHYMFFGKSHDCMPVHCTSYHHYLPDLKLKDSFFNSIIAYSEHIAEAFLSKKYKIVLHLNIYKCLNFWNWSGDHMGHDLNAFI